MSTLDATISMLETLPENELQTIHDMTLRFYIKKSPSSPFQPMSEQELLDALDTAKKHADEGRYEDADVVVDRLRAKYDL